ncbi:hypothetical protein [Conexibacter sp. CPCC 206217]|uniref:hypothetical protein n=1 Tax=Conexibacter sp. CPCC 206217 TaxID=3064574 RepID=UPI0027234A40|nr:hypothetical protein [Conexibacter sp. CPCC 206217]MDO8209329.1 hypothetical protein [Conexibacter sp. CPCC 206217]
MAGAMAGQASAAGIAIQGGGASLQNVVQGQWLANWGTSTRKISGGSGLTYVSDSSGRCLNNWGFTGGSLGSPTPMFDYCSSDDPPSTAQIAASNLLTGTTAVTVPVTQAPVAVILGIPSTVTGLSGQVSLTNALLNQTFAGTLPTNGGFAANTWGALLTAAGKTGLGGAGLNTRIKVEGRSSTSGTTYAFKNYLAKVDSTTWLRFNDGTTTWPSGTNLELTRCSTANSGGSQLAGNVAAAGEGAIGYANLADAVTAGFTNTLASHAGTAADCTTSAPHLIAYALVQNNGSTSPATYGDPISSDRANVRTDRSDFTTTDNRVPSSYPSGGGSWFDPSSDPSLGITANRPDAGLSPASNKYGIVAVTYMIVFDDYQTGALGTAYGRNSPARSTTDVEDTACNYVRYVVSASPFLGIGGQQFLSSTTGPARYYAALPTNPGTAARNNAALCG